MLATSRQTAELWLSATAHSIDTHTDGTYAVMAFSGQCPVAGPTLAIDYRLFEGLDPQHRGLLNLVESGQSRSVVFSADSPQRIVGGDTSGPWAQFSTYLNEGVWHIWTGFDHILFLLSLLLPAVLVRDGGRPLFARSLQAAVTKPGPFFRASHSDPERQE